MPAVQPGSNTFRQTGIAHRASKDLVLATLHQHRFTAFSLLLCTVGTVLLICGYVVTPSNAKIRSGWTVLSFGLMLLTGIICRSRIQSQTTGTGGQCVTGHGVVETTVVTVTPPSSDTATAIGVRSHLQSTGTLSVSRGCCPDMSFAGSPPPLGTEPSFSACAAHWLPATAVLPSSNLQRTSRGGTSGCVVETPPPSYAEAVGDAVIIVSSIN
jgi:hypothetical protein